ncbi:MAG: hypothetical protein QFC78_11995 [Pseudomonadota bacterium]|nr:hypothetical protein [Pseudomonadota bacterium]
MAISFSVLATVALTVFGVDPAMHANGGLSGPTMISVQAPSLPGLSQLLPSLN